MKTTAPLASLLAGVLSVGMITTAHAEDAKYSVTITNLTAGQILTPIMVVSHKNGAEFVELGHPASDALSRLAEGGDTAPLEEALAAQVEVLDTAHSDPVPPGHSVTVEVDTRDRFNHISIASMLIPTNDAFIAIENYRGPKKKNNPKTLMAAAYDAGTEVNDQLCAHIPGPDCGGEGYNAADGEGYIYVHSGIHDAGDLSAGVRDWNNPVARIVVERVD